MRLTIDSRRPRASADWISLEGVIAMWFDGVVPDSEEPRDAPPSNQADSIWSTDDVPVPAEPLDTVWSAHATGTDPAVSMAPLGQTFDEPSEPEIAGASHQRTLRSKLLGGAGLLVTLAVVVTVVIRSTGEEGSAPGTTVSETKASTTTTVPTTTNAPRNESSAAGLGDGVRWPDAELQPTVTVVSESVSAARPIGPTGITLIGAMPGGGMSYIDIDAGVAQSWATSERLGGDLTLIKSADAMLAFGKTDDPAFAFRKGVQEPLGALFATMGVKLPGPVDGTIWIPAPELDASRRGVGYRLVTIDGLPVGDGGAAIDLPDAELLGSDGRGGLVVSRAGDVFAVGIDGVVRLTTGALIAVGADTVYVRECTTIDVCEIARVDRRTGDRSTVDGGFGPDAPLADPWPPGVGLGTSVSPDGDVALVQIPAGSTEPAGGAAGVETWAFVDTAGRKLTFIDDFDAGQPVVWSADSRFATVLADSNLYVFDREAGDMVPLSTQRFRAIGSAASPFSPGTAG